MATSWLTKQLKPYIEQLEDLLASSRSLGKFGTPLDRCAEILQELLRLSSSFSAVKVSCSMPYPYANRIFKNTVSVVDDIVQLQTYIAVQDGSCSPNCALEEFLPGPETQDSPLCAALFDPKQDASREHHLVCCLNATLNIMKNMQKLLMIFKSLFFGSDEISDRTYKFYQVWSELKEIISRTESSTQMRKNEDCVLSTIFCTLNKPVLIAMNALCLLFEFLVVEQTKLGSVLELCKSAVSIFVNATGVLSDLTQFFSEGYPNLKVSRDQLAQTMDVIVKYCAEIFSPKANCAIVFQSLWNDDFLAVFKKCIYEISPQNSQDTKCKNGTSVESMEGTNDGSVAQNGCNINRNSGDTSTNVQSISALTCSYQVMSDKNMNHVSIVQNFRSIKYHSVDTSTYSQSICGPTNSFQDTSVAKPEERIVLDEFTNYFKSSCTVVANPTAVKNAPCMLKKPSVTRVQNVEDKGNGANGAGIQHGTSSDDASEWRSILTERVEDWYAIALKTSADLAASAHFFCDSVEANFVFLNNGQKHRVAELVNELKDAMNIFSIKENSARLKFFCHACKRYVFSKRVQDHVVNEEHLRKLRVEAKKVTQRHSGESDDSDKNIPEPKICRQLEVYNRYFKDFDTTVANSAPKSDEVNMIVAEYSEDLCSIVSKAQKRPYNLSKNLLEYSNSKISKINSIEFSSWRVKSQVSDWSDDDA